MQFAAGCSGAPMGGERMDSTALTMTQQEKRQFRTCYMTFALNGVLALTVGSLLPYVRDACGLDYLFAGLLVSLHSIGNLIASFVSGLLPLAVGRRKSILLFSACYSVSFTILLLTQSHVLLALAFFLTGFSRGAVSNFNNSVINEIAPGRASALNALHACFALGAFSAPLLVMFCAQTIGIWQMMCFIMMAFGLCEFILYATMPISQSKFKKGKTAAADLGFLKCRQFWLTTGTLFFYLCTEQGVIGWMVTYFKDSGIMSDAYAQTMASVLWILILAGRLSAAYLARRSDKSKLMLAMGIGMTVFFAIVMLSRSLPVITFGIAGFGFSMAGIYPTAVSQCGGIIKTYPLAWSFILTTASFGSILMPSVIGAVAESFGILLGMSTVVLATLVTLCFILVNLIYNTKRDNPAAN
jgi:fucose permease